MAGEQLSDIDQTRLGLMEVMVGAMAHPQGTFDHRSIVEFIRCALKLHAWCIREDLLGNLAKMETLDIASMLAASTKERLDHSRRLSNYASFMAAPKEYIKNSTTTH